MRKSLVILHHDLVVCVNCSKSLETDMSGRYGACSLDIIMPWVMHCLGE